MLAHAHQLAALAAAGDAEAAANLTGEAGRRSDPDLLVLLSVSGGRELGNTMHHPTVHWVTAAAARLSPALQEIAFSEGGREGALAACEEVNGGCVTTYGCRNSFQRCGATRVHRG